MNIFKSIDEKLNAFAKKQHAKIYPKEIPVGQMRIDEREIRKILWDEGIYTKAIIITPSELWKGSNLWDFNISASPHEEKYVNQSTGEIPFWTKDLLEAVPFQEIERQIDDLLITTEKLLAEVKMENMRVNWDYTKWPDGHVDSPDTTAI